MVPVMVVVFDALTDYLPKLPGCVATFKKRQESKGSGRPGSISCSHLEQLVDELNLLPNIQTAHPPRVAEGENRADLCRLVRTVLRAILF